MSRERFEWLEAVASEVITTPGSESNVREIFEKCSELQASTNDIAIFNQFDDLGNYLWHYWATGSAMEEVIEAVMEPGDSFGGVVLTTGSAGTIASGDYLKERYNTAKIAAGEALQCPTLLLNGFGEHRIEGIGDKHVPRIHNVKNTDMVIAIDDDDPLQLIRLFNDPAGVEHLGGAGVPLATIERLPELGISSAANILAAVKFARYYGLGAHDVVVTVATDSIEMYRSRLSELDAERNSLDAGGAAAAHARLLAQTTEHMLPAARPRHCRAHRAASDSRIGDVGVISRPESGSPTLSEADWVELLILFDGHNSISIGRCASSWASVRTRRALSVNLSNRSAIPDSCPSHDEG